MAIYKQPGSSMYWVSIYRAGQPRLRVSTGTAKIDEARMIEATLRQAQRRESSESRLVGIIRSLLGTDTQESAGIPFSCLAEAAEQAARAAGHRPVSEWTARHRKAVCARLGAWAADHWPRARTMQDVDHRCAFAFADALLGTCSTKTRLNIISELGTIWRILIPRTGIADNPWTVARPKARDGRHGRAFSQAEETAIMQAAITVGHDWHDVCLVARYTGLRYGDIAHLRWESVDLPGGRITLKPGKTARHGIELGIPLHPRLAGALAGRQRDPAGWVFPEHAAGYKRHLCGSFPFTDVLEAAGITDGKPEGVTFHSWRHTFRTRLSESGASQEIAMVLGGWTQASTAGIYSHDWGALDKAIRALA